MLETMNGRLFFGIGMAAVCMVGLIMASRAVDDIIYVTGLVLFVFGVINMFVMIHRLYGHSSHHDRKDDGDGADHGDGP